jgi:multisubunit Na+/H+ antiporter MnhB subunit
MRRFRLIAMALLATFAVGIATASTVQAKEAPFWTIEGTRLAAGKTHFINVKLYKEGEAGVVATLTGSGVTITCKSAKIPFEAGALLGSNPEEPGTSNETIEASNCTVEGNGTKCNKIAEPIVTNPLKSELGFEKEEKNLLLELKPVSGTNFATVKFTAEPGGKCTIAEAKVTGSVVAEVLNEKGENVKLPTTREEVITYELRFPSTAITSFLLYKAGATELIEVGLNGFGAAATLGSTMLLSLAKVTGTTLESQPSKWAPLP